MGAFDPTPPSAKPLQFNWGGAGLGQAGSQFSLGNQTDPTNPTGSSGFENSGLRAQEYNSTLSGFEDFGPNGIAQMTDPANMGPNSFDWGNLAGQAAPLLTAGASLWGAFNTAQQNKRIERQMDITNANFNKQFNYSKGLNDKRVARHDRIRNAYNNG